MTKRRGADDKTRSLREQGALHPRPSDVKDELFDGAFFDPRDVVQVRYEMLRRVNADGREVSEVAAGFGVSRPTFYKAKEDFEREGLPGLIPRKRGPKGGHKLTEEVLVELERRLQKDASLSSAALADLVREQFGREVHPRTVERALERRKKKPT